MGLKFTTGHRYSARFGRVVLACAVTAALVAMTLRGTGSAQQPSQTDSADVTVESPTVPEQRDAHGRDTPRSSVQGFLEATDEGDFERAAEYLDLRGLPEAVVEYGEPALAKGIKIVLERSGFVDLLGLSDSPDGLSGDGLPDYRDELMRVQRGGREVILLMQRVPSGDDSFIWKISNATVSRLPELYEAFGYGPLVQQMSDRLPEVSFLGVELFKWVLALGVGLLAVPPLLVLGRMAAKLIAGPKRHNYERLKRFFHFPVTTLGIIVVVRWSFGYLGIGASAQRWTQGNTLLILAGIWCLVALINLIGDAWAGLLETRGRHAAVVLLKPLANAAKAVVFVLAFVMWLDNLGIDITTLLAGLGIGGVAIALSLQKPMEDFFGALTLFTQQPARVGDFCRFADRVGTIEEISLRSTRLRTPGNTVISLPNSRFAAEYIENISARQKILYHPTVRLRLDTPAEIVEQILSGIREALAAHEQIDPKSQRVRFTGFARDALKIEIFTYVLTTNWSTFLEATENLNLQILKIVASTGAQMAAPLVSARIDT